MKKTDKKPKRVTICVEDGMHYNMKPTKAFTAYYSLMVEARARFEALRYFLEYDTGLGHGFVEECCYLQFRMLTEILASACVVAYGELNSSKLHDVWEADKIIKMLSDLDPNFYPQPMVSTIVKGMVHIHPSGLDHLRKNEISSFVGRIGGKLHRGKLKKILVEDPNRKIDIAMLKNCHRKLYNLLAEHCIVFKQGNASYYCHLFNPQNNGGVSLYSMGSPEHFGLSQKA